MSDWAKQDLTQWKLPLYLLHLSLLGNKSGSNACYRYKKDTLQFFDLKPFRTYPFITILATVSLTGQVQ